MANLLYRRRQSGSMVLGGLAVGILLTVAFVWAMGEALGPTIWVTSAVTVLLVACLVLFSSLTVEVTDDQVRVWFGPGLIRRTFSVRDIRAARPVRNQWWYGWGIRLTPHGWLFNVSGLDAVELEFDGDRRFRIGTDDPQGLAAVVERAIGSKAHESPK